MDWSAVPVLFGEGELGLPPGLNTAPMPWWVNALFMAGVIAVNGYILLALRRADIRRINADTDLKIEAAREAAKQEIENTALAQWKAIARNEIKLRGEAEERHRKEMLDAEEKHNRKVDELVTATRREVHEVRNDLGARINEANAEVALLRRKEWECQRRMARFEGIARANGWDLGDDAADGEPVPDAEPNGG